MNVDVSQSQSPQYLTTFRGHVRIREGKYIHQGLKDLAGQKFKFQSTMIFLKEDWAAGCGDKSIVFHLAETIETNITNFPLVKSFGEHFPKKEGDRVVLYYCGETLCITHKDHMTPKTKKTNALKERKNSGSYSITEMKKTPI